MAFELRCDGLGAGQAERCRKEGPGRGKDQSKTFWQRRSHIQRLTGQRTACPGVGRKRGWRAGKGRAGGRLRAGTESWGFHRAAASRAACDSGTGLSGRSGRSGGTAGRWPCFGNQWNARASSGREPHHLREHLSGVHRGVTGMRLQKAPDQRRDSRPQGWRSHRGSVRTEGCADGHGGRSIHAEAKFLRDPG